MKTGRGRLSLETRALVAVAVLLALLALLKPRGREAELSDLRPTTYFSGNAGLRALYLAAEDLGVPVRQWRSALGEGRNDRGLRALAVVAPDEPLTPGEAAWLAAWVERGGRLFYVPRPGADDRFLSELGFDLDGRRRSAPGPFRWSLPQKSELRDTPAVRARSGGGPLSAAGLRILEGTPERVFGFPLFLRREPADGGRCEVLLSDGGEGVAAALLHRGEGRVVLLSHARGLLNGSLRESGAGVLALRALAELSAGEPLWFDEFHHGFDDRAGVTLAAWRFLTRQPAGWAAGQLAVLAVAAVFFAGLRMGRPRSPSGGGRRSPLEHTRALAAGYTSARARRRPATLLLEGLRLRLGARTREGLEARLSAAAAEMPALRDSVKEIERALGRGRLDADLIELARAIDRVLDHFGGHHAERTTEDGH